MTADKTFYLPKETIKADLQSDYFFGKPVAGAKVKVTASTFDVAFKDFQTVDAKTDANGHAKFEIQLPDYFVGQPLQKGDALVKLEVKVTDTADHTETITRTYPVSDQPIRVSLLPEGGRITPGLENRVFAAAIYPDGSPAAVRRQAVARQGGEGQAVRRRSRRTRPAWPSSRSRRSRSSSAPAQWGQHNIEMLGGQQTQVWGQQNLFDLYAEAGDAKGATAKTAVTLNSGAAGRERAAAAGQGGLQGRRGGEGGRALVGGAADGVPRRGAFRPDGADAVAGRQGRQGGLQRSICRRACSARWRSTPTRCWRAARSSATAGWSTCSRPTTCKIDVKADRDVYLPGAEGKITLPGDRRAGQAGGGGAGRAGGG